MILRGATYHIVFSDAAHYPPPFRLENLSQMPVTYFQSGVSKPILLTLLNPGQSVPYAWDEPTYPERLSLQVKGSREIKEFDMNTFGPKDKLYYESYFYITAVATFPKESRYVRFYICCASIHMMNPWAYPLTLCFHLKHVPPLAISDV